MRTTRPATAGAQEARNDLEFSVRVYVDDAGTWTAWLRDTPALRATAQDRDAAVGALVDRIFASASFSVPG